MAKGENSKFISDMSFVTNSNSVGVGARFQLRKKVALNIAYFKTFYKHYSRSAEDFYDLKSTFGGQLAPVASQLVAGKAQLERALSMPNLSQTERDIYSQKLSVVNKEIGAVQQIQTGLKSYSTYGSENFHRTNDVFGLGLEINF